MRAPPLLGALVDEPRELPLVLLEAVAELRVLLCERRGERRLVLRRELCGVGLRLREHALVLPLGLVPRRGHGALARRVEERALLRLSRCGLLALTLSLDIALDYM